MVAARSVLLSMLFVRLTLAHRDVQNEQHFQTSHELQIDKDDQCEPWCTRKVEHPRTYPNGSIQDNEKCQNERCTWNTVCSYSSGKCKACSQCKSRCEPWCEGKVGKQECGKQSTGTCTREEVCGFGNGVKCSDCGMCKVPTTTKNVAGVVGCEEWCAGKIGKKECDGKLCTWDKICTWSSGKCSKCHQCPTADPTCSMGVRSKLGGDMKRLCCKHTCGSAFCGGPDCATQGRDSADCCRNKIFDSKKSCKANLPPCVLENQNGRKNDSNRVKTLLGLGWAILMALAAAA
mmetsp:Transcript_134460/g.268353  ORF Transcript_134460/g.268353 Transcript_134460/m.268353 type:complete len:290 (-) Transcript_134460:76-945(-)